MSLIGIEIYNYLELKSTEASSIEELKDLVLKVEEKINLIRENW